MSSNDKSQETTTEVIEEEDELEETKAKNVVKIQQLIKELDKLKQKGGPDIRICPRCFSLRVKVEDVLAKMGIRANYPVCICMDCGWRSRKWIYLDRTMSEKEREKFVSNLNKEENES
ncbi:MAG: hypothetical protein FK734_10535 [Asgard group archaeon]|nr:hypothetical protein [Asgard group archaeon]